MYTQYSTSPFILQHLMLTYIVKEAYMDWITTLYKQMYKENSFKGVS